MEAVCKNCGQLRDLQRSHAIPNSFFKLLARGANGQFIELNDGPSRAKPSQDSGRDFLLCSSCEKLFDVSFDRPLIEEIRHIRSEYRRKGAMIASNSDLKSSIASIVWRASLSNAHVYKGFKVPATLGRQIELEISCRDENQRVFSYSLQPIFDPTPREKDRFSDEALECLILTPKPWKVTHGFSARKKSGWGAIFIMGGVVITMIQPRFSNYRERKNSYLLCGNQTSRIRPMDMWSIPYVKEFFAYAVHKEREASREMIAQSPSSS